VLTRRAFSTLSVLALNELAFASSDGLTFGRPEAFSFETLTELARTRAAQPYNSPAEPSSHVLDRLDYDQLGSIQHPLRTALHAGTRYPASFFHLGGLFRKPVRIFALDGASAREVIYRKTLFDSPADSPARDMPEGAGFAGFRLHDAQLPESERQTSDWAAFLGASYFRTSGDEGQYGISARGIAINTAHPEAQGEEFPEFSRFYIAPAHNGAVSVFSLLDGPSITGAYRFSIRKHPTSVMEVNCRLFFRTDVRQIGIAPATSMFFYSETYRYAGQDYRPEVHDSDGLALWTDDGEQIWRPLNNPAHGTLSSFSADGLKGFGLLQRDRAFASYRDPVNYQRRPHLWIEPLGNWGKGSVQLLELPTAGEYHDNVVAFWAPAQAVTSGDAREFSYRLHWGATDPVPSGIARCVATRLDKGFVGSRNGRQVCDRQFLVEFDGQALAGRNARDAKPVLTISRGEHDGLSVWPEADGSPRPWRVSFRVSVEGEEPVEMRLFVNYGTDTVSETWAFQYHPRLWA